LRGRGHEGFAAHPKIKNKKSKQGSTFSVTVCTVSPGHWVNQADTQIGLVGATRLTGSDFRMNLLLLKGQGCVLRLCRV